MRRKTKRALLTCFISLGIILTSGIVLKLTHGSRIFKKYVCNPIPKSVRNIKAHRPRELSGHRYVMHFNINMADVDRILNSRKGRRFRAVEWVSYKNDSIYWGEVPPWERRDRGEPIPNEYEYEGLELTHEAQPAPEWFRPNDWKSPKVWVLKERSVSYREHIQILIYNERLGEAYMVEYQEGAW